MTTVQSRAPSRQPDPKAPAAPLECGVVEDSYVDHLRELGFDVVPLDLLGETPVNILAVDMMREQMTARRR